jgi:hypothetical protein
VGSRPGNPHSLGGGSSVTECDTYRQFWQVRLKAPTERNIVASARRVARRVAEAKSWRSRSPKISTLYYLFKSNDSLYYLNLFHMFHHFCLISPKV